LELRNLIAQSAQVDMYGEPKSNPKPRVFDTPYGLLLEQPNELGLMQSIFGFSDQSKFLERRVKGKMASLAIMTVAYLVFLSPISLNLGMFPAHAKPILSITVIASLMFLFADFFESMKLARLKESLQKVDCQFTLLKRGILGFFNPKISKVNVIFKDGRESLQSSLLLESFNKVPDGEPVYGSAYIDASGRVVGIVNGATSLIKSKVANWAVAPVVLYLVTMPFCISSLQPDVTKQSRFDSGNEYYQQGVLYKAYGWTEKARESMIQAQHFDSKTKDKAKLYIRTHLPLYPISKDAEQMNIKGYNLMASSKTDKAIEAFKKCMAKYPEFEWPYGNLGSLYIKLGDFDQARVYLDKAIAINPDYINALRHLAELELRQGHRKEALLYLDKISALDNGESYVELQKFAIKASL
jgi:type IV pilus assembly protein PilF